MVPTRRALLGMEGADDCRIVASAEYDQLHSVVKMKEDILDHIGKLI